MSSLVKNLHPEHLRKTSVIIGNGYCLCLMTLFSWRELLIQHTLFSSFESLFMWINIKSFIKHLLFSYSTQSKSAFNGHLDEWVLSWPQLHLSFYTWHPESLLQSFWVNLHQRSHRWLGCETCVPWRWIRLNSNFQVDKEGWTNQTIPCFLLSSWTWIQSWIASLYSGLCCIWHYHCQRLIPTKGLMRLFYQTRAISSLALWWLCKF